MLSCAERRPSASIRGASLILSLPQLTCSPSVAACAPANGTKLSRCPNRPVWTVTHSGRCDSSLRYTVATLPTRSPCVSYTSLPTSSCGRMTPPFGSIKDQRSVLHSPPGARHSQTEPRAPGCPGGESATHREPKTVNAGGLPDTSTGMCLLPGTTWAHL